MPTTALEFQRNIATAFLATAGQLLARFDALRVGRATTTAEDIAARASLAARVAALTADLETAQLALAQE